MGKGSALDKVYSRNNWDYVSPPKQPMRESAFKDLHDSEWAIAYKLNLPTKECTQSFKELRACVEANGDRLEPCHWYLRQWNACNARARGSGWTTNDDVKWERF